MTCLIDSEVDIDWGFDHVRLYERAVDAALSDQKCPYEAQVNLLITDDESIREINKVQRGIDSATDVLSFPMTEYAAPGDFEGTGELQMSFDPETGELLLGDIVLSKDRIEDQAKQYGHEIEREYAFLIVHSMLHLCGYDHIEESDRILMEERQKIIMNALIDDFPKLAVDR